MKETQVTLEFFVEGTPVPKGRPRVTRRGTYTPAKTFAWESLISWEAKAVVGSDGPSKNRLSVSLFFVGARQNADIDNLAKSVLDAMNGIVYEDDKQIDRLEIVRSSAGQGSPGVRIVVESL